MNGTLKMIHLLTIKATQARIDQFVAIFGSAQVPVTSHRPLLQDLNGRGFTPVYMLDMGAISMEDKARLIHFLSIEHGATELEVEVKLGFDGLPITAEGTEMRTMPAEVMT